jgi:hypothetical protein
MQKVFYIPKNVDYIIVADMFAEDYCGGAELTLEAILEKCPDKYFKIHCQAVTTELIKANKDKHWILGNFASLPKSIMIELVLSKVSFSVIECDYKYCRYRSSHLHFLQEKKECTCYSEQQGIFVRAFFDKAKNVFFMSEEQKRIYEKLFEQWHVVKTSKYVVLSSVFLSDTLKKLSDARKMKTSNNGKMVVLSGGSWIKAQEQTEQYCKNNKIEYDLVGGLQPNEFLEKISQYKGLVFHPAGFDTCPRLVIEAKLLGLQLDLNDNVQHKNEEWFSSNVEECEKYLEGRADYFWKCIIE